MRVCRRITWLWLLLVARVIACTWLNSGLDRDLVFSYFFISVGLLSPLCTWCSSFSWESHFYYMNQVPPCCSSRIRTIERGVCAVGRTPHLKFYPFRQSDSLSPQTLCAPQKQITGFGRVSDKNEITRHNLDACMIRYYYSSAGPFS